MKKLSSKSNIVSQAPRWLPRNVFNIILSGTSHLFYSFPFNFLIVLLKVFLRNFFSHLACVIENLRRPVVAFFFIY
jgi:hypothetical protein